MQSQTAVVIGATGLIGGYVVQQLLNDDAFNKVKVLVRNPFALMHKKLQTEIVDFNNPADYKNKTGTGNSLFCCVGTTQQKVKGDKQAYRKVDYDIPVNAAKFAKEAGFENYLLVSAVGANVASSNFYLRLKGEVERDITNLNFKSFHIFQPSILLGKRKEFRLGETVGKGFIQALSTFLIGSYTRFKPVEASDVAAAMVAAAKQSTAGKFVYQYGEIIKLIR